MVSRKVKPSRKMNCKVCQNVSGKNPGLSFFRFPSEYNRCRDWAERCDILYLFDSYGPAKFYKSFRICSEHFDCKYIVFDGRKKKLLSDAVPKRVISREKISETQPVREYLQVNTDVRVTQKLLENLCRFCAEENAELTDIFSWKGKALELEEKITVFPITVNKLDQLPLKICSPCIVKISKFYDFVRNCVKADARLKTILGISVDLISGNNLKCAVPGKTPDKGKKLHEVSKPNAQLTVDYAEDAEKSSENDVFLFLQSHENGDFTKDLSMEYQLPQDENGRRTSQSDSSIKIADTSFSYITSEEHVLLTESNDVFGKKIRVSTEGSTSLERYVCNVCSKTFSALEILESHWKAHSLQADEHGRFLCQNCKKVFPNKYRLNEHNRLHTGEYPFKCTVCDKKFHKMALLKQHSIVHESLKRFVCSVCNLRSSRKGNLIQHLRSHFRDLKKDNCKYFSLSNTNRFDSSTGYKMGTVANENCQKLTTESNHAVYDMANNTIKFICGKCHVQFLDIETLEGHLKDHTNPLRQKCILSLKGFSAADARVSHSDNEDRSVFGRKRSKQRKRLNQRTYQCEECGVRFKRKDTLTNHVRIHTGERPFVCGSCGFAFKQKGDCLKHERNHQKKSEQELMDPGNRS